MTRSTRHRDGRPSSADIEYPVERDEDEVLKQDLIWSFGGAIGVTLIQAVFYDYSVEDSLKTGLLFLVGTLVITYSKDLWRRRRASRSAYPESTK